MLKGRQAVTVLLDLIKCFERVLHVIAFKNALNLHFPPLLLKWVFLSYRHLRLLQWQGAVSENAVTARGIVAECGATMAMLRAVLIPTLDEFSVHYTSMGLEIYAGDIACRYEALELETLLFPRMTVDQLVSDLAAQSGLEVSWDKFLLVASHVKLAKRFAQYWTDRGVKASTEVVSLGVDLSAGRPGTRAKQMARLKLLMRRAKRLKRLHNAGAKPARIMSGGALASMKYGVSVVGLSDARLALVRNRAAYALRRKRMDSLTMWLMLVNGKRFEPIFDATLGPAMAWSVAHWLNVIPKEWIMLWKKMVRRLEATSTPWARADGPAAVVYLSMKRVGIQMPALYVMLFLEEGSTNLRSVDLYYEAPETVRVLVCRACEMWQWAKPAPFEGLIEQVIWKPPLVVATRAAGGVSANDAATFRACLKMQLWPKDRKAVHGLAGDDDQLCDFVQRVP